MKCGALNTRPSLVSANGERGLEQKVAPYELQMADANFLEHVAPPAAAR